MKKVIMAMMIMMIASCAYGDVEEFRYFSLDVPDGWTASEDGSIVTVKANDGSASLVITVGNPGGKSISEIASAYSAKVEGDTPELDDEGNYTFGFNNDNNERSQVFVTGDRDFYMIIIANGIENSDEVLGRILSSLEMK